VAILFYVAQKNGELTEILRIRVSENMKNELVARAGVSGRSAGAVARAAIRSYLQKGKR
jgi:hypothetical protein